MDHSIHDTYMCSHRAIFIHFAICLAKVCCLLFQVSLLLGTVIRKIPLPSCTLSDSINHCVAPRSSEEVEMLALTDGVLDLVQLETIGSHFLQVLLKMKHNGAIDKTRAGFTALCNRLLCSNDPRYTSTTYDQCC